MSEQSFSTERRTLLAGKIVSDFGQSSIDCVVRRISERGATVTTESPLGIPKRFQLLIPNEGAPKLAKVVWQSGNEIGLEFENDTAASPAGDATEHRGDTLMRGHTMLAYIGIMQALAHGRPKPEPRR